MELELVEDPLELDEAIAAGRSNIHGTATCLLLELDEVSVEEPVDPGEVEVVPLDPLEPVLLPPELLAPPLAALLSESTAKSIRPDAGLMMVSLIVPNSVPEEPATVAPVNWLARTS